jgi:hypothetical protein
MGFFRVMLLPVALVLLLAPMRTEASVVTFYDGTFNPSDWSVDAFEKLNGGSANASQALSGGNPGEYYRIINTVNSGAVNSAVYGLYLKPTASYTPSTQGAIISGSLSIDTQMFAGFGLGEATRTLLQQDGKLFIRIGSRIDANNVGSWLTQGQTFEQNDFQLISSATVNSSGPLFTDPLIHPDFTSTGSTIIFGFSSANSTTGTDGYRIDAGYDNWRITLNTVPEPTSMVLWAVGGFAAIAFTRRRRTC